MSFTNTQNVAPLMAAWLADDRYDHDDDPYTISVTTLIKPLKQTILASRVPPQNQAQDVMGLVKSRMGTAIHDSVEITWTEGRFKKALKLMGYPTKVLKRIVVNPPDDQELAPDAIPVYLEQRVKKQVGKWTVSGKYDCIFNGEVQDIKSTGTYSYVKGGKTDDYRKQGSMYRWLLPDKITADTVRIHYLFTDWSAANLYQKGYPEQPVLDKAYELASAKETELFITSKLADIERLWRSPESEMEPCSNDDLWVDAPVYKFYKDPAKKARSTKNFDTYHEAAKFQAEKHKGQGVIDTVFGEVKACRYCPAFHVCKQKDEYLANGRLKL